jgi:hypothetical protein
MKARHGCQRGFTLVELMVAMLGGLFVSMAVFTIAKHSSSFAMQQSRVSDATLQAVVGFERLRADISRAGYLSTPNLRDDPTICRAPAYPIGLQQLASIQINPVAPVQLSTEITVNDFQPQRVTLSGSYNVGHHFSIRQIDPGPPVQVTLQDDRQAMVEIGYTAAPTRDTLLRVFQPGRALQIIDDQGRIQVGVIADAVGGPNPTIVLANVPALQFGGPCGFTGLASKGVASVVNLISYDLRDLNTGALPQYAAMFRGGPTYEATRRELVREELDLTGNPFPGTLELISEYAVDLGFSLLARQGNALAAINPANVPDYASFPYADGRGPQQIRAVRFWLSTRSQEADRTTADSYVPAVPGPTNLRMSLHPTDRTRPPFARVRTLQSTISLNNQASVLW